MADAGPLHKLQTLHEDRPLAFWAAALLVASLLLTIGAVAAPELVVEDFIWKNFWGPTEADANQQGVATRFGVTVTENYTLLSELVYGAILAAALYSIYIHLFRRAGVVADGRFVLSLTPYILFGPVGRVLEDADVFCRLGTIAGRGCEPGVFSYVFISPLIYIFTAAIVIAHMVIVRRALTLRADQRRMAMGATFAVHGFGYAFIVSAWVGEFTHILSPWLYLAFIALAYGVYELGSRQGWEPFRLGLFALGVPLVLGPLAMELDWATGNPWSDAPRGLHSGIIPWSVGMAAGITFIVWILARHLFKEVEGIRMMGHPLNLGLVFGHMLDGFATFLAICSGGTLCGGAQSFGLNLAGYGEKHPVSEFFLTFADGWGFPMMKLALVLVIIHLIDRSVRDGDEDATMIGLVKMAVLILGLGPGVRDVLRVAMGV